MVECWRCILCSCVTFVDFVWLSALLPNTFPYICYEKYLYSAGAPRGRGRGGKGGPLKFDSEFDFESSNQQFNKEDIERELKEKLTISSSSPGSFSDT